MSLHENLLINYFNFFSKKDLQGLKNMFSDDITLIDWEILESGIENVTKANENIFNSINTIEVTLLNVYKEDNQNNFSCEIEIIINGNELLKVIDVICFDKNDKINLISAYKQ